jgi:hypothetical protein
VSLMYKLGMFFRMGTYFVLWRQNFCLTVLCLLHKSIAYNFV